MKLRVTLTIYTDVPLSSTVFKQLHLNELDVEVVPTATQLIVTGSREDIAEVLFFYHDRDMEAAHHEWLYGAEVVE